jgi:hypothetical protein
MVKTKVRGLALLRIFWSPESSMSTKQRVKGPKQRAQTVKAQSDAGLAEVARATNRTTSSQALTAVTSVGVSCSMAPRRTDPKTIVHQSSGEIISL